MLFIEWILFCLGHLALSCVLFNRVHAFAFPKSAGKRGRKLTEKLVVVFAAFPFALIFYYVVFTSQATVPEWLTYCFRFEQLVGIYFIVRWCYRGLTRKLPVNARPISSEWPDMGEKLASPLYHGFKANLFSWIPFNQATQLKVENWEFQFPHLPDELNGLKICQLSDLHFTGLIDQTYFSAVVDRVNAGKPELIFITGDILDEDRCLDWIEEVLSKLHAKYGVYFIRGNHDLLISDQKKCLQRLRDTGMIWTADGDWHEIQVGNSTILLAGTESPWFTEAKKLPSGPAEGQFRILLSHSPDQIGWAVKRNFDLVFAGHTHGGQIRLPIAGPVIAPSRYGIKFASGTFKIRDTLMHVSRGISGDEPVRINCPPELGFFMLVKSSLAES